MRHADVDTVRRALMGFQYGTSSFTGWASALFEEYTLHPYVNVLRPETQALLSKKTMFGKLVPVFAKGLRITGIVNALLGIDVLHNKNKGPSIAEEIADILMKEAEARKTIVDRLETIEKDLKKSRRSFSGLAQHIHGRDELPTVAEKTADLTGALVAVEGVLNHVTAVSTFDPRIASSLAGSGVEWILSDVPFFSMTSESRHHTGNFVGLKIDSEMQSLLYAGVPFLQSIGWFPYVIAFGAFQESISPRHPGKALELAWVKLRKPRFPDATNDELLDAVLHELELPGRARQTSLVRAFEPDNPENLLLLLCCMQLIHQGNNVSMADASERAHSLASEALSKVPNVPADTGVVLGGTLIQLHSSTMRQRLPNLIWNDPVKSARW